MLAAATGRECFPGRKQRLQEQREGQRALKSRLTRRPGAAGEPEETEELSLKAC